MSNDKKQTALKSIEDASAILETQLIALDSYQAVARFENLASDVRAKLALDGLLDDAEIKYQFQLYENKTARLITLMNVQSLAAGAYSENLKIQLNRSADQRSRAYAQLSSFSEKLTVIGVGFLAAALSVLGLMTAKLKAGEALLHLRLFEIFLVVLFCSISLAIWTQFSANRMAHTILMATAHVHDTQLKSDMKFAFRRSEYLQEPIESEQTKTEEYPWNNDRLAIVQLISLILLILSMFVFLLFLFKNLTPTQTPQPKEELPQLRFR
jgi:uncharacterized membrane protein YidH (DUF202 family)